MCGLAGLSVGCGMTLTCPKTLLIDAALRSARTRSDRSSPLASWDARSSVRTRPRPAVVPGDAPLSFPRNLVPIANHEIIRDDDALCERILARHLFRYLHFTAKLEHLVVNRTVLSLAHETIGLELPDWMRLDAHKIYCDEGYHALVAAELAATVAEQHDLAEARKATPYFMRRLAELIDSVEPDLGPLLEILFVVCSETLISGTLSHAAEAPEVPEAVREALSQHAHDERRHHAYFAELLRHIWPQLTRSSQRKAGALVPALIDAFLRPDFDDARAELRGYGLDADEVEQILAESYPAAVIDADRRHIARYTVRHFEEVGALDYPEVAASFERTGLVKTALAA